MASTDLLKNSMIQHLCYTLQWTLDTGLETTIHGEIQMRTIQQSRMENPCISYDERRGRTWNDAVKLRSYNPVFSQIFLIN
jgi:hypothetical protein